ncbi:MAG: hypothetical protein Q9217_003859 [Psora testacea]
MARFCSIASYGFYAPAVMPSNKKKRQATANPVRGFATTSVPSKQNTHDLDNAVSEEKPDPNPLHIQTPQTKGQEAAISVGQREEKQPPEMSPEEFEAQLEIADLQILLEKHGERSKRDASRQVSKLKSERRLLRAQADLLATSPWLPPEIMQHVFDYVRAESSQLHELSPLPITSNAHFFSDNDALLQFWKLFLTITQLGFSHDETMDVLRYLLKLQCRTSSSRMKAPKDGLWGLTECLDWLALKTIADNKFEYETRSRSPTQNGSVQLKENGELHKPVTNNGIGICKLTADVEAVSTEVKKESSGTESESCNDSEPEQMIGKYLAYQSRLYELNPNLVTPRSAKASKKFSMKGQSSGEVVSNAPCPKVARLQAKIAKIRSDILFDQQEADARWASMYTQISREAATRRQLNINNTETIKPHDHETTNPRAKQDEEPEIGLNDFFGSLPEPSTDMTTGMTIRWSRPQRNVLASPFDSIRCDDHCGLKTRVEMVSLSCPDTTQSEAFVSTVALFVIFALSPKEERAHLRLSPAWRDLWIEMTTKKQDAADASDRQALRDIRSLIAESQATSTDKTSPVSTEGSITLSGSVSAENTILRAKEPSPSSIKTLWFQKSSTLSFQAMLSARRTLPIWQYRRQILDAIENHQVVIVSGQTGCGKSTQVPAYILENELSSGRSCKIYCTEPRRISAISLARRVSQELGEGKSDVGTSRSLVGFAIRLESQMNPQTKLVYATTGIVMRMLESSSDLDGITHLLLDEIHERSIDSDFLLIILRKCLVRRPALKIVLMSATVDAQKFSDYLGQAPVFEVPGRMFPVTAMYLEDAIETAKFTLNKPLVPDFEAEDADQEEEKEDCLKYVSNSSTADSLAGYMPQTKTTLSLLNEYRIPYDLIVKLLVSIQTGAFAEYSRSVLIFLPGIAEIRRLNEMLTSHHLLIRQYEIFALHSAIATEEQERPFLVPPNGMRKIVLATNIAETGITIPDITCVIDTGKHKEMRFDERRQLSRLIEAFISQANAVQRRGRAGRVRRGLCFHLFTKQRFQQMSKEQTPEMLRLSLQDLVLRVKICKLGGIEETLSQALDPPSAKNIRRAIDALQDVKALTPDQDLTPLGRQLARLPLDVFLGKLLLLGTIFECLDAAVTITAVLSSKSPFATPTGSRSQADQARLSFKRGDSDLLTIYNVYSAWRRVCNTRSMSEQDFCRKNFLSLQTLSNIEDLKGQLLSSLVDASFITNDTNERTILNKVRYHHDRRVFVEVPAQYNTNNTNDLILNSVIAMSFYPKLLKREGKGWRNVVNQQGISLHPTSVNRVSEHPLKWLSFYHIMQSNSKFYNAHETSAVEDMAVALLCGDAEFKMYAGVVVIDGNRIRFSVKDWKTMLVLKTLRVELKTIIDQRILYPGRHLTEKQQKILEIWWGLFKKGEERNIS